MSSLCVVLFCFVLQHGPNLKAPKPSVLSHSHLLSTGEELPGLYLRDSMGPGVMSLAYAASTQEAEAEAPRVHDQPGLHSENLSQKKGQRVSF
jgi:hypothetical protein